ncbi:MAG: oligosaccharide flippase family protein [Cytophagales bacterium]|nr:oligosaccharide flippase family protein [Cytophagales bacterium]
MGIVIRQAFWVSFLTYFGVALGYINTFVLFPTFLSIDQIGLIRLIQTNGMFLVPIASLGMPRTLVKYHPQFGEDQELKSTYYIFQTTLVILGNLILLGLLMAFLPYVEAAFAEKSEAYLSYIYVSFFILFSQSLYEYFAAFYRAHYNITIPNYFKEVHLRMVIVFLIIGYGMGYIDFEWLIAGISINYLSTTLFVALLGYIKYPFRLVFKPGLLTREWLKETRDFGAYVLFMGIGTSLILNLGSVLTSTYLGLEANGIFVTCLYLATIIEMPKRATSQITSPIYAKLFSENDMAGVKDMYVRSSLNLSLLSFLIFIGIMTNLEDLFMLIPKGDIFRQGFEVVVWIGAAKVLLMVGGTAGEVLVFSGYRNYNLHILWVSGLIMIILNVTLIPTMGISGAAMAMLLVVLLSVVSRYIIILKTMGLSPWSINHLKALIIGLITFALFYWIPIPFNAFWNIVVRSLATTLVFGGAVLFFGASAEAEGVVKIVLKKVGLN